MRELRIGEPTVGKLIGVIQRPGSRRYYVASSIDAWVTFVRAELGYY